ncbi:hypothetical protein RISK_003850 [Rhodopirellula islandica]|uniref:Uncharacterized protein n=1 Tax=Rhodopirellula islandica TaxID=595434 RepID=A0A0J1EFH5_RHOIS|nr:hypothetical protein RISK_003850 [Rhodopirellula islandica]
MVIEFANQKLRYQNPSPLDIVLLGGQCVSKAVSIHRATEIDCSAQKFTIYNCQFSLFNESSLDRHSETYVE